MAKKKSVSAGNATEPTPEAFSPPLANECPTQANVRAKLQEILTGGGHTHYDAAIKQESLLPALLERYDPPLSTFCSGMVAGHMEAILDADPNVLVTARGRVYYRVGFSNALETTVRTRETCPPKSDVRTKMEHVFVQGRHTTEQKPIIETRLIDAVLNLYDPSLSDVCSGAVLANLYDLLEQDDEFVLTGKHDDEWYYKAKP